VLKALPGSKVKGKEGIALTCPRGPDILTLPTSLPTLPKNPSQSVSLPLSRPRARARENALLTHEEKTTYRIR
jgi:hypothetical protein